MYIHFNAPCSANLPALLSYIVLFRLTGLVPLPCWSAGLISSPDPVFFVNFPELCTVTFPADCRICSNMLPQLDQSLWGNLGQSLGENLSNFRFKDMNGCESGLTLGSSSGFLEVSVGSGFRSTIPQSRSCRSANGYCPGLSADLLRRPPGRLVRVGSVGACCDCDRCFV
jgi:hypothetical protein